MLLAIVIAAHNLDQLINWAKRTENTDDPLTTMDVTQGEMVEVFPEAATHTDTGPPLAA